MGLFSLWHTFPTCSLNLVVLFSQMSCNSFKIRQRGEQLKEILSLVFFLLKRKQKGSSPRQPTQLISLIIVSGDLTAHRKGTSPLYSRCHSEKSPEAFFKRESRTRELPSAACVTPRPPRPWEAPPGRAAVTPQVRIPPAALSPNPRVSWLRGPALAAGLKCRTCL